MARRFGKIHTNGISRGACDSHSTGTVNRSISMTCSRAAFCVGLGFTSFMYFGISAAWADPDSSHATPVHIAAQDSKPVKKSITAAGKNSSTGSDAGRTHTKKARAAASTQTNTPAGTDPSVSAAPTTNHATHLAVTSPTSAGAALKSSNPDKHPAATPADAEAQPVALTASTASQSSQSGTVATAVSAPDGPLVNDPLTPVDAASLVVLTDAVRRELLRANATAATTTTQQSSIALTESSESTVPVSAAAVSTAAVSVAAVSAAATPIAAVAVATVTSTKPVANNDTFTSTENTVVVGNVLTNDTASTGTLTAKIVTGPANGTVTLNSNGTFTYTPKTNFTGLDTFTYVATANSQTSAAATVTIGIITPPRPVVGTMGVTWWAGLTQTQINQELEAAKSAGAISMRIDISWYAVGATKGTYNFSMIDPIVQDVVDAGLIPLAMIYDTPTWLSGSTNPHTPPANATQDQQFAQFAAATAQRYAGIIQYYEVWNEENIPAFWTSPNAANYTKLLQATYTAIKAVDPNDFVVAGGLSPDSSGIAPTTFVTKMYAAGAKGYFDALAYHWYAFPSLPTMTPLAQIYSVMVANGDAAKQIWITEAGAPTGTAPGAVSQAVQAQTVLTMLNDAASYGYIGPLFFFTIMDTGTDTTDINDNYGLVTVGDVPKQAYCVLQQFVTGNTSCSVSAAT